MTIRQVLIGTALGVTALAVLIHRLPKSTAAESKNQAKQTQKSSNKEDRRSVKNPDNIVRLSLSKTFE
jgi:hypothetical protein